MRISDWSSDVCSSDLRTPVPLQAVIFDLDGVLTDTARVHYVAWKQLADSLDIEFNETINRRLKGVDRMGSLDILLERSARTFSAQEKLALCERKNASYRRSEEHTSELQSLMRISYAVFCLKKKNN